MISAPDFGSVSLVESVVDDERAEAEREMQKLTSLLEKHNVGTLREHLRIYETFTVDQILRDFFFRNYHNFSLKSYVVAIY